MDADGTSGETDRVDDDRRRALALLGLWAAAAFLAPILLKPLPALADSDGGDGGDGGDGNDGHGDDDDDDGGPGHDGGSTRLDSGPPEAP